MQKKGKEGMSKSRHTEAQMIGGTEASRGGAESGGCGVRSGRVRTRALRLEGECGGMDVSQAQEARQLRDENTKLRKLVADLSLDKEALQSVIRKNGWSS